MRPFERLSRHVRGEHRSDLDRRHRPVEARVVAGELGGRSRDPSGFDEVSSAVGWPIAA